MVRLSNLFIVLLSLFLLPACNDFKGTNAPFDLTSYKAPLNVTLNSNLKVNFYKNVPYGFGQFQTFDYYQLQGAKHAPLVIYIHGGAFIGGDKTVQTIESDLSGLLARGINFIAINYSLLNTSSIDPEGIEASLFDSLAAIEYLSHQSNRLGIDPDNIAIYGDSIGGSIALWVALGANNKDSKIPKIKAVAAREVQASLDFTRWQSDVFSSIGFDVQWFSNNGFDWYLASYYGLYDVAMDKVAERVKSNDPELTRKREVYDVLKLIDANDPAIYINNSKAPFDFNQVQTGGRPEHLIYTLFHHQLHVNSLHQASSKVGLDIYAKAPELEIDTTAGMSLSNFLIQSLVER